jgi:hypothetical protein
MAKKKNSQKKHTFKHSPARETTAPAVSVSTTDAPAQASAPAARPGALRPATAGATVRDFSYVAGDMKRIGWFAVGLIGLELGLYYLMTHTSLGQAIYNLVKV